jgi:hypothetical protein
MKRVVFCDIDQTIADGKWRETLITASWDAFHAASIDDKPFSDIIQVVNSCPGRIVGVTSRPEKWRDITNRWLVQYSAHFDELLMRANDDFRPANITKVELIKAYLAQNPTYAMSLIFEDDEAVTQAYRAEGWTVLQVHAGKK